MAHRLFSLNLINIIMFHMIRPRKKVSVVQVTQPTLIFYPTLNFFSNSEVEVAVLLFSSNFRIWRKNTYQNDKMKSKSKFLSIHSLVFAVKAVKQGYIFKNRPFNISFVLFNAFPSRSKYSKKKVKKKKYPTYLP